MRSGISARAVLVLAGVTALTAASGSAVGATQPAQSYGSGINGGTFDGSLQFAGSLSAAQAPAGPLTQSGTDTGPVIVQGGPGGPTVYTGSDIVLSGVTAAVSADTATGFSTSQVTTGAASGLVTFTSAALQCSFDPAGPHASASHTGTPALHVNGTSVPLGGVSGTLNTPFAFGVFQGTFTGYSVDVTATDVTNGYAEAAAVELDFNGNIPGSPAVNGSILIGDALCAGGTPVAGTPLMAPAAAAGALGLAATGFVLVRRRATAGPV